MLFRVGKAYLGANEALLSITTLVLVAAIISFHGPGSRFSVVQGNYTALLQADYNPIGNPSQTKSAALAQTGQIPQDAVSIRFLGGPFDSLQATFAGQLIPLFQLGATNNNYVSWGGDVSAFAGQSGELRFMAPFIPGPTGSGGYLDDIFFSPQAVPEPGVFGLFALGSLLLGWRFWKWRT